MEQAANQASGNSNVLGTDVTSRATARKKRFGGSSLTTWITMAILIILAGTFFLYLLVPLAALLFHAPPSQIWEQMQQPDVLEALKLSFVTTAISTTIGVIFGLPAAIILARTSFPGHRIDCWRPWPPFQRFSRQQWRVWLYCSHTGAWD